MKALIYTGPKAIELQDVPMPEAGSGEALIKIEAVGICGSDMHAYLGHDSRRPAPLILGHEAAGMIVRGTAWDAGRRVVINPLVSCGTCPSCLDGRANICARREIISMPPRPGAFAEYVTIPERNLIAVPDGMDAATASLTEPIATGWHAVTKAAAAWYRPFAESSALVFGGGAVGIAAALSLHAQGCRSITVAETNPKRRETVEKANLFTVVDPLADGAIAENAVDVVIDCVGANPTRAASCKVVRPGGVIIHVGLADSNDGLDIRKLTLQEVTFIGTYTYTMTDFRGTLEAMRSGALGALDWFEQRDLGDGPTAFDDLLNGRAAASKIVLRPTGI